MKDIPDPLRLDVPPPSGLPLIGAGGVVRGATGPELPAKFGISVIIDNRVPPSKLLMVAPDAVRGVLVNVETYWHLRYGDSPRWVRFAVELRRRTLARMKGWAA